MSRHVGPRNPRKDRVELDRRDFLRATGAGLVGIGLADRLTATAYGETKPPASQPAKAKSVILIALNGGMTQFETFDPKPKADPKYLNPYKAIPTNVPGIEISELMPQMAKIADKYDILRAMLNPRTGHGEAAYIMMANAPYPSDITSNHPSGKLIYPAVGAIVGMKKTEDGTYKGDIPPWVCVGQAPFGVTESFLGPKWKPFIAPYNGRGKMNPTEQQRLAERQALLKDLQKETPAQNQSDEAQNASRLREDMFRIMTSDAQKVFDLSEEKDAVRERYGQHTLGQGCLMARRLVEYGVPFVSIPGGGFTGKDGKNWGWDMHEQLTSACKALVPILDQSVSALLTDLSDKGLLDSTIVVLLSENGKAPALKANNAQETRQHWGNGFSVVVAGGGFKGGRTVGEMDDNGELVQSRPIYPWDMWESVYTLLGIDPNGRLPNPTGCVAYVSQANACGLTRGGILTEIM